MKHWASEVRFGVESGTPVRSRLLPDSQGRFGTGGRTSSGRPGNWIGIGSDGGRPFSSRGRTQSVTKAIIADKLVLIANGAPEQLPQARLILGFRLLADERLGIESLTA